MELAEFKARYSEIDKPNEIIQLALDDANTLIHSYNITDIQKNLAIGLLSAHLLTVPKGETEGHVTKVKADTVEVQFSDRTANNDWLQLTSYGKIFANMILPSNLNKKGVGVMCL